MTRTVVNEQSACYVNASHYNDLGEPLVPSAVDYRIDDVTNGRAILPWTSLSPSTLQRVLITSAQNAMDTVRIRSREIHRITFRVVAGTTPETTYPYVELDVVRSSTVP